MGMLQIPHIETVGLQRTQVDVGPDKLVLVTPHVHSRKQLAQRTVHGRRRLSVQGKVLRRIDHVQFIFLPLMPRRFDDDVHHTVVLLQTGTNVLRVPVQSIIIVPGNLDPVRPVLQVQRIAETPLAHAIGAPIRPADGNDLADDLALQDIRERRVAVFILEFHGQVGSPPFHAALEPLDFLEPDQEVLQNLHLLVQFVHTSAQRHLGTDVEFHLLFLFGIRILVQRLRKEAHGPSEHFAQRFFQLGLEKTGAKCGIVRPFIPRSLFFLLALVIHFLLVPPVRKGMERYPESQHQQDVVYPLAFLRESDVLAVKARPSHHPFGTPQTFYRHAAAVMELLDQSRHEEQGHDKRHRQVDDDNPREVVQVALDILRHEEHHHQRPYCGEQGGQYGQERFPVVVVTVMVHHHDGRVDNQSQRHRDAGQRKGMQAHVEHIVSHDGYQDVGGQRDGDNRQILPVTTNQPDEHQQDGQRHQRARNQLFQFRLFLLGCVVRQGQIHAVAQPGFQFLYFRTQLARQLYLVGIRIHDDVHVDGVQPVYAVVTARQPVPVFEGGQVVQIDNLPVHGLQGHLAYLAGKPRGLQVKGDTALLPFFIPVHHIAHDIRLSDKTFDAVLHVCYRQAIVRHDEGVVRNLHIFGSPAGHVHALHLFPCPYHRFDVFLHILFYLFAFQVGIHLIGQQMPHRTFFLRTAVIYHFPTRQFWIRNLFGQFLPHLLQERRNLELHGGHIGFFLQHDRNPSRTEIRLRRDFGHAFHRRDQPFYLRRHLLLHHLGRGVLPSIAYRQRLALARLG